MKNIDFTGLAAMYVNCSLKKSTELSHTQGLMHLAQMLKTQNGYPSYGNSRKEWDNGTRWNFENPEYR